LKEGRPLRWKIPTRSRGIVPCEGNSTKETVRGRKGGRREGGGQKEIHRDRGDLLKLSGKRRIMFQETDRVRIVNIGGGQNANYEALLS